MYNDDTDEFAAHLRITSTCKYFSQLFLLMLISYAADVIILHLRSTKSRFTPRKYLE